MDDLVAFLRARNDEREQIATAAAQEAGSAAWNLGSSYSDLVYSESGGPIIAGPYANGFLPDPLREHIARIEVGQIMLDWLKVAGRPGDLPEDDPWRPDGWTPPPPGGVLFGVPVVLREDLDPAAWRAIDRDGNVMKEGAL